MQSKIQVLDEKTINKIAAGEVIENSSSCVKELIENALDARATQIEVHIVAGGRKKIEVIDNGLGMSADDALLSVERHATSKIRSIEDMETILSKGFRGEALASIGAISHMHVKTCDGERATEVVLSGGKLLKNEVTSRPQGTTIEVHSLFFNVPARQKFQKSVSHDIGEVERVITHLALAHPEIGFRFVSDGKEIFHLIGQPKMGFLETTLYRIQELYGSEIASSLVEVDYSNKEFEVVGFISKPVTTRPNRLGQHFYINGRSIQSKLLAWGLQEGYSTRLPERRYPLAFLFVKLPGDAVDINVHPQKREVRFKDPISLKKHLVHAVDQALQVKPKEVEDYPKVESTFFHRPAEHSIFDQVHKVQVVTEESSLSSVEESLQFVPNILGIFDSYFFVEAKSCKGVLSLPDHALDGILLIHQKRAKERLLFEHLLKKDQKVAVQNLLLPETLELSLSDTKLLEPCLPLFDELGVSIRSLRGQTYMIDGLPAFLKTTDAKNIMEEVLAQMRAHGFHNSLKAQKEKLLAKAISKTVRFEKKVEQKEEAEHLVQKLMKSADPILSPQGKPIIKIFDQNDLSKLFS